MSGIINEYHEPPSFNGVERPNVDNIIVPYHLINKILDNTANSMDKQTISIVKTNEQFKLLYKGL